MPTPNPRREAHELLEAARIRNPPVPVERLARFAGAEVRYFPLDDELSGMVFASNEKQIIGVNSLHHLHRQRFTIAHEIGHLILHANSIKTKVHVDKTFRVMAFRDIRSGHGIERMEIEANQFAAALLMPESFLVSVIRDEKYDIDDSRPIDALAQELGVSRQALEYRIRNLLQYASGRSRIDYQS